MEYKYYSRRNCKKADVAAERRKIEQQRLKYNLLGMLVILIILILSMNLFNLGDKIIHLFTSK